MPRAADNTGVNSDRHETDAHQVTRRLFQRVDVSVSAAVMQSPAASPQAVVALVNPMMVDISATGACIQVQTSDVTVLDELALDFVLDNIPYHAAGVVVWVCPIPELAAARLGLKFEGMPQTQKTQLARHIVARKHRLPPRPTSAKPAPSSRRSGA